MPENLFFIQATPEAIRLLLTTSNSTIAPALQGALAVTGRLLLIDKLYAQSGNMTQSVASADAWLREVEEATVVNNKRKDSLVRIHNSQTRRSRLEQQLTIANAMDEGPKKQERLQKVTERIDRVLARPAAGFNSRRRLADQGLPGLEQALEESNLPFYVANGRLKKVYPTHSLFRRSNLS